MTNFKYSCLPLPFLSIPQSSLSALNSGVTSYGNPKHVP